MTFQKKSGFLALELLIALSILGFLTIIAVPAYQNFKYRLYFADIVKMVEPIKVKVEDCYKKKLSWAPCDEGKNLIPSTLSKLESQKIKKIEIKNGVIHVTPIAFDGIVTEDTYVLHPVIKNNEIEWLISGGAFNKAYVG